MQILSVVAVAVLAVLGIGVTAWVFWPIFKGPEAARQAIGTHRLVVGSVVTIILLNLLFTLPLVSLLHLGEPLTSGTFLIEALATDAPLLVFVYIRLILPGAVTWADLGFQPRPWDYVLRMGLSAGLGGLILIDVIVGALLSQVGLRPNQIDQFKFVLSEGPGAFALVLFIGAIVAPCVEEIFFRGFVFGLYRRRKPLWVAYLASGVLFTLPHLQPPMTVPEMAGLSIGIFLLAMMLAWLYQRTGSIYPGIVAHAVNNATGLILFYAVGLQ